MHIQLHKESVDQKSIDKSLLWNQWVKGKSKES